MEQMHKSRTMWFSLALMVFGAMYENLPYLQAIIDPKWYGISFMAIGIITAILRFVTRGPVGYEHPDDTDPQ
jgi:hypothetical protein